MLARPLPSDDSYLILVRGRPNGLAYDAAGDDLYAADAQDGTILRIAADRPPRAIARIPSAAPNGALAGLTRNLSGTMFVARLGWGESGAIFRIDPDGRVVLLTSKYPTAWHLGVAFDDQTNMLYASAFHRPRPGVFRGFLLVLDPATGAMIDMLAGFEKPTAVLAHASMIWIVDQRAGCLLGVRDGAIARLTEGLPRPDSIARADERSVFVTCFDELRGVGSVEKIDLAGNRQTIAHGTWQPRGIAFDGETRLFVGVRGAGRILVLDVNTTRCAEPLRTSTNCDVDASG
jgi:DNA-binding beta-propeller fold protein YncE